MTWAESVNKFFEPSVRIQTDRGHRVIDGGPYAIVRHPGYVSGFFVFIGMPVSLGSWWALIPAFLLCMLLVVRTIWEDQTLRKELVGYEAYAQRVRYRLIPGVWWSSWLDQYRSEVTPDPPLVDHVSAPNHPAGINLLTAVITHWGGQRNLSLLAKATNIVVEEQLDFFTHCRPAHRA